MKNNTLFLPNFCDVHTVFFSVVLTELLAFVLCLAPLGNNNFDWTYVKSDFFSDLALTSLFIQWVNLVSMMILCLLRPSFIRLNQESLVGVISYFVVLLVTWLTSELAWRLDEWMFTVSSAFTPEHHWFLSKAFIINLLIGSVLLLPLYYHRLLKKKTLILSYLLIIVSSLVLIEIASLLLTPIPLRSYALQHHLFLLRNIGIGAITSAIVLRYFYIQHHWHLTVSANDHARIQALQARIRPHFLFNSMNTIASLIRLDADKAEQAVMDLSTLFRASLSNAREWTCFSEEITLCLSYLRIESLRLEDRLNVVWNIETIPKDAIVPPLLLQPLIENAIYHGIQPLPEGGTITITGLFDKPIIKVEIENSYSEHISSTHRGNQLAQQNIRERLHAYYGSQAKLTVTKNEHYCVTLYFPYRLKF